MRYLTLMTCAVCSLVVLATGGLCYLRFLGADDVNARMQTELIERQFASSAINTSKNALAQAEIVAAMAGVQQSIASRSHDEASASLRSVFATIKSRVAFDLLQSADSNNKVLARAHDPARFGDDETQTRPMVVQANVLNAAQSGIELGSSGLRIRGVAPVYADGVKVGTVEVGQNLEVVLDRVKRITGDDIALLVDRNLVKLNNHGAGGPAATEPPLVIESTTNSDLFQTLTSDVALHQVKESKFSMITLDGVHYGFVQSPILDFSGAIIGNFAALKNLNEMYHRRRAILTELLIVSLMGAIIVSSLILLVFRGLILRPAAVAAAQLEDLAAGVPVRPRYVTNVEPQMSRLFTAIDTLKSRGATA